MDTAVQAVGVAPARVGAPTLYRPEYCEQIISFFLEPREPRKAPSTETETDDGKWKREYRVICGELPSLKMFAFSIGVAPKTISEWQNRHPAFREACARAQSIAEAILTERANNGQYNAQFATFYAKNVFGWKDKTEIETVSSQDSQDMAGMKAALAAATPDELAQISALFDRIQGRAKALPVSDSGT